MADTRVLIIADDPLARAGLAALLSGAPGIVIVGQAEPGMAGSDLIATFKPDAVLWDLGWTAEVDSGLLVDMAESGPSLVLLVSAGVAPSALVASGVRALLNRDSPPEVIAAGIIAAQQGLTVLAPEPAADLLRIDEAVPDMPVEALTVREMEVLQLLAEGAPNKEIARRLAISEHTVKFHVNGILGKLDAQSRTEAVVRATRAGLILL